MFISVIAKQRHSIKFEKFTDHPIAIGTYPYCYGQIMTNLTHDISCTPCDNDGNEQRREYHRNPQWFPDHTPSYVFEQPKNDMQIFHFSIS